jgi:hypothetical protein
VRQTESYGVVLATVNRTWRNSGELLGASGGGNAAHLEFNRFYWLVEEVQGDVAEGWTRSGERWWGGERVRARRRLWRQWCLWFLPW